MAYVGSTATTTNASIPRAIFPAMSGPVASNSTAFPRRGQLWYYNSSGDLTSNLCTPGYFTDGLQLGMAIGDLMMAVLWTSQSATAWYTVFGALTSTNTTGGFNMTTDNMITSTFS